MYMVGSPPESVTPPPEIRKKGRSVSTAAMTSSTVMARPTRASAPDGQASAHTRHRLHLSRSTKPGLSRLKARTGQIPTQVSQPAHSRLSKASSRPGRMHSGL